MLNFRPCAGSPHALPANLMPMLAPFFLPPSFSGAEALERSGSMWLPGEEESSGGGGLATYDSGRPPARTSDAPPQRPPAYDGGDGSGRPQPSMMRPPLHPPVYEGSGGKPPQSMMGPPPVRSLEQQMLQEGRRRGTRGSDGQYLAPQYIGQYDQQSGGGGGLYADQHYNGQYDSRRSTQPQQPPVDESTLLVCVMCEPRGLRGRRREGGSLPRGEKGAEAGAGREDKESQSPPCPTFCSPSLTQSGSLHTLSQPTPCISPAVPPPHFLTLPHTSSQVRQRLKATTLGHRRYLRATMDEELMAAEKADINYEGQVGKLGGYRG